MDTETQAQIDELKKQLDDYMKSPSIVDHYHNGFDSSRVNFSDIYQKKIWLPHTIIGTSAATAANYSRFWIAPIPCYLNTFKEVHQTAGTDGSAVTIMLEKLTGTTAPGSGVSMLSAGLSLKSTANTLQSGTLTTTIANKNLIAGDMLALKLTGTPTSVANVSVLVELIVI